MDSPLPAYCPGHNPQPWRWSDQPLNDIQLHLTAVLALARETVVRCEQAIVLVVELSKDSTGSNVGDMPVANGVRRHGGGSIPRLPGLGNAPATDAVHATPLRPVLTEREREVLRLIAAGHSNRVIADTLFLSPRTIERHIANIYLKIDAHSKAEATAYALRHALA